jgi:hypothetical protein
MRGLSRRVAIAPGSIEALAIVCPCRYGSLEAQGGRDEAAVGERCPDGRQEVGSEPGLNDIAEPACHFTFFIFA